jgi:hypothetical protein
MPTRQTRPVRAAAGPPATIADPALSCTDPRWALAVHVEARLTGTMLRPVERRSAIALGRSMGLTPFDCNLVIAIVQDRARRGRSLDGAVASLAMVPAARPAPPRSRRAAAWMLGLLLLAELAAICLLWPGG